MIRTLPIILCLLLTTIHITAQENPEQPASQFLYRDANHLILVDGYTGETAELPFEVSDADRFSWSPDGQYLLAELREEDAYTACLNLYDVDALEWVYDEPISCDVEQTVFFSDSDRIAYETFDGTRSKLWLFNIAEVTNQELYRTSEGEGKGISNLRLSPTETYLIFVDFTWIMGGSLNSLVIMNMETETYFTLSAPALYYASYNPIWSEDDNWFLIILKDEYVTSGAVPRTNHQGDVYLINADTGEQYRLTYTPASYEANLSWTDDGGITFTEVIVIEQTYNFTIEEARNVEDLASDEIIMPEDIDIDNINYNPRGSYLFAPDPNYAAWIMSTLTEENKQLYVLNIGNVSPTQVDVIVFSQPMQESYQADNTLIGWRPSDYPYDRSVG